MKKQCPKYIAWHVKKGKFLALLCFEINLTFVPTDTWWLDSRATTHIIEAIGTFRLQLITGFCLNLFETFVVSLDKFGFSCSFGNNKVSFYQNSNVVGSGSLIDNLYMLDVVSSYNEILQIGSRGTKRKLIENSVILWHKHLGHISKQRIQRLVSLKSI
ncbi:hypothetical protein CR513_17693, partial [Mucuna pruriens]